MTTATHPVQPASPQPAPQAGQQSPSPTTWVFDPPHTTIEFQAKHMVFTTVKGRFYGFTGAIVVDEQNPARSSVHVEIDATSLDTHNEFRDNHLRSPDFLDAATHPTLTFRSTRVELPAGAQVRPGLRFTVVGDLTIRGTTREVRLDSVYHGTGINPDGERVIGFSASTRINRRDWGLNWNQAIESGGWLVGDEIKIELEAQANPLQP